MYGGALPVARKRKSKKKATSKVVDVEDASEPKKKKAKKDKRVSQEQATGSVVPSIQDEVQDLVPAEILDKRTISGMSVGTSQSLPPQPLIPKQKRKHNVRKLKESTYVIEEDDQVEEAIGLVTREVKRKKAVDAATLQNAVEIVEDIEVPVEDLLKESTVEASH
jgi:hypothetical protein